MANNYVILSPNRCGPLVHVWCMRYEAKHSYFKQLVRVTENFKNMLKTLSIILDISAISAYSYHNQTVFL